MAARIKEKLSPKLDADDLDALFGISANGPISTLGARILIAHALGIFGNQTPKDLKNITEVRNAFAHSPKPLDFDAPELQPLCLNLHTSKFGPEKDHPKTARDAFTRSVAQIVGTLTVHLVAKDVRGALTEPIELP